MSLDLMKEKGVGLEEQKFNWRDIAGVPTNACFENIAMIDDRTLEITYRKDKVNAGEVLAALTADGLEVVDVSTRDPDLEDVFLSLTRENAAA